MEKTNGRRFLQEIFWFWCKFCYVSNSLYRNDEELGTNEWKDIIRQAHDNGMFRCNFTGGEVLTRNDFCELYAYTYDLGVRICILSNGMAFNEKIIDF